MKGIAEKVSAQTQLDWTVFRVPHWLGLQYPGETELSRRSPMNWVLEEIQKKEWVRKAPMLVNC
jgi:hypothetical protein